MAPRHVDLRPFVLTGRDRIRIVPGGLTRVALKQGLAGGQFEPGRRHQGHLGAGSDKPPCSRAPPTTSTGSRATSSAPNIWRASSKRPTGSPRCRSPMSGTSNEWESAVATAGCARAFFASLRRGERRERHRIPRLLDRQPVLDPQLLRGRAHQRARGAHRADDRDVGRDQRRLARAQALRQRPDLARGVHALPALGAGSLAPLRRLRLPHHAAQRRLLVLAARRLSSSAPTTPRASSTSNITCCCRRTSTSAARSTISSGRRSCARCRRSPPITGSIAKASSPG